MRPYQIFKRGELGDLHYFDNKVIFYIYIERKQIQILLVHELICFKLFDMVAINNIFGGAIKIMD